MLVCLYSWYKETDGPGWYCLLIKTVCFSLMASVWFFCLHNNSNFYIILDKTFFFFSQKMLIFFLFFSKIYVVGMDKAHLIIIHYLHFMDKYEKWRCLRRVYTHNICFNEKWKTLRIAFLIWSCSNAKNMTQCEKKKALSVDNSFLDQPVYHSLLTVLLAHW